MAIYIIFLVHSLYVATRINERQLDRYDLARVSATAKMEGEKMLHWSLITVREGKYFSCGTRRHLSRRSDFCNME